MTLHHSENKMSLWEENVTDGEETILIQKSVAEYHQAVLGYGSDKNLEIMCDQTSIIPCKQTGSLEELSILLKKCGREKLPRIRQQTAW